MTAKISLRNATEKLLRRSCYRRGLLAPQIIATLAAKGIWSTDAPTPVATLRTVLARELAKGTLTKLVSDDGVRYAYAR